jgi:hypothetical protein
LLTVRIEEYDLGGHPLDAYCVFLRDFAALAVDPDLPPAIKRAKELRAYGDWIKPPSAEDVPYLSAHQVTEVEVRGVRSIRRVVDDLEPEWVDRVKKACRETNIPEEIAGETELDLSAVVAILENLIERGELPP